MSPRLIDITGQKFGMLTVKSLHGKDSTGKTTWLVHCECGSQSVTTGLNLKSGTTKSCGCLRNRKGEQNPRYKPIPLDVKRERKRAGAQYKHWRKSILLRCPVCIRCGAEEELQVHHLKGSHEFPEHRFDPQNGVTLCNKCHTAFHVKYGRRKGFSESNAEEFIDSPIAWAVTRHKSRNGIQDLIYAKLMIERLLATSSPIA